MNKVKKISEAQHKEIAEDLNEIIDMISSLSVKVANYGGKTKMRFIYNRLTKNQLGISDIRFEMENRMLCDYPDAPLYTQCRKYKKESGTQ